MPHQRPRSSQRRRRPASRPWRERLRPQQLRLSLVSALMLNRWRTEVPNRITIVSPDLTGNAYALAVYLSAQHQSVEVYHLIHETNAIGPGRSAGPPGVVIAGTLSHRKVRDLITVARSAAVVTSWGSGQLRWWLHKRHRPVFADTWHGVGYKARITQQPGRFRAYDALFASSPHTADAYQELRMKAHPTGYARLDTLTHAARDGHARREVRERCGLSPDATASIVLFAPTWLDPSATVGTPFEPGDTLAALNNLANDLNCHIAFRPHPVAPTPDLGGLDRVHVLDTAAMPHTEHLLAGIDVLITDWSSIATDFLVLDRPVIYLDVPAPSDPLFPLDASDRPGDVVADLAALGTALHEAVTDTRTYQARHAGQYHATRVKAWGDTADGNAAQRYVEVLQGLGVLTGTRPRKR